MHIICPTHRDVTILAHAFGWSASDSMLTQRTLVRCEVCADPILREVWDIQAEDLAADA